MPVSVSEYISPEQLARWDNYVLTHVEGTFAQMTGWARLKEQFGWTTHVLVVEENSTIVGGAIMMDRAGMAGAKMSYVPYGPLWDEGRLEVCRAIVESLVVESGGSVVLRLEPHLKREKEEGRRGKFFELLSETGFEQSGKMLQPEATLMLDLSQSEEDLMAGMRQTTRRYIRQAERAGLAVTVDARGERLEEFYRKLKAVDERKHFGVHTLEYYQKAWQELRSGSDAQPYLFFVQQGEVVLGAYFLTRLGNKSWELYGGVKDEGMKLKANYLLKWQAIKQMKQEGVVYYDQWGVAPLVQGEGGREKGDVAYDKSHSLAGVTYFKDGFGGERVEYSGSWDLPQRPILYRVAKFFKKI